MLVWIPMRSFMLCSIGLMPFGDRISTFPAGFFRSRSVNARPAHTPDGRTGMIVALYLDLLRYLLTCRMSIG